MQKVCVIGTVTFLAAQVASQARGFLSRSITIAEMHQQSGDIHHIVRKAYLQENGFADRGDYNQVANFALTETSINISTRKASSDDVHGRCDPTD